MNEMTMKRTRSSRKKKKPHLLVAISAFFWEVPHTAVLSRKVPLAKDLSLDEYLFLHVKHRR